jgi:signal transduction histidine kinase
MTLAFTVFLALLFGTGQTLAQSNCALGDTSGTGLLAGPDFYPLSPTDMLSTKGVFASAVAFWYEWWFPPLCVIVGATVIFAAHRLRLHQMSRKLTLRLEERLAERVRVAQELHDTLLQGVLSASMQLDVAVDQLPPDSPALPAMNRVLQLMGQVIDEGRNTLRGLRSSIDNADDLKSSLSRIPTELGSEQGVDFRVVVEGLALPLRSTIRDDVFGIGREALVNAFRHSQARSINLRLRYSASQLRLVVCDDGCGIDPQVLRSGRDRHSGLPGMRERAERIGAKVRVLSRVGGGTEVELRVPSDVAFESHPSRPVHRWFTSLYRREKEAEPRIKQHVG